MLIYKKLTVTLAYLAPIFALASGIGKGIWLPNAAFSNGKNFTNSSARRLPAAKILALARAFAIPCLFILRARVIHVSMAEWPFILVKAGAIGLALGLLLQLILVLAPAAVPSDSSIVLGTKFTAQLIVLLAVASTLLACLSALHDIGTSRRGLQWKIFWAMVALLFELFGLVLPIYAYMNSGSAFPIEAILAAGVGTIGTALYLTFFKRARFI